MSFVLEWATRFTRDIHDLVPDSHKALETSALDCTSDDCNRYTVSLAYDAVSMALLHHQDTLSVLELTDSK